MPKLKTHRGAAKRFRRTATGFKRKRQLRGMEDVAAADVPALRTMLPTKAR